MWLSPTTASILHQMQEADDRENYDAAEIVCDGGMCYVGHRRIAKASVLRLLRMTAISDCSDTDKIERYRINDTGRAILRRPALVQDIVRAIIKGGSFTIRDDHVVSI